VARPKGRALEQRRTAQAEAVAARRRASQRKKGFVIAGIAVGVLAVAVAIVLLQPPAPGVAIASMGNDHIASVDAPHAPYNSSPPSSGPHLGNLASWGEYTETLPPELFVHNLEDGGVLLAYSCTDCGDFVDSMRTVIGGFDGRSVVLFPYDDIVDGSGVAHRGAAVAWGRVLYFDTLDEETRPELGKFIKTYEGIDHHVRVATP